jgi:hypothetical protein
MESDEQVLQRYQRQWFALKSRYLAKYFTEGSVDWPSFLEAVVVDRKLVKTCSLSPLHSHLKATSVPEELLAYL